MFSPSEEVSSTLNDQVIRDRFVMRMQWYSPPKFVQIWRAYG